MISNVHFRGFKCFDDERIDLAALTLLTGVNGAGKSSLIQALLLLEQTTTTSLSYVPLNGAHGLELGQVHDVLSQSVDLRMLVLDITTDEPRTLSWAFDARDDDARHVPFVPKEGADKAAAAAALRLAYLCAERVGPRDVSPVDSVPLEASGVGTHGEFTPQVLAESGARIVRPAMRHPRTDAEGGGHTLLKQAELWMQDLVPGLEIRSEGFPGTNAVALRVRRRAETVDFLRPSNLAFGVTAALPIIVGGLLAPERTLFIVDAPESHLHPRAQSLMGRFLSTLAAASVQVIVETHSDHVLNGVRLGAVDGPVIAPDKICIQYFHGDSTQARCAERISVLPTGGLSSWPEGFFDQTEKDLARIVRVRPRG